MALAKLLRRRFLRPAGKGDPESIGGAMHARVTRYEGGAPATIEEALEKKRVLPTEFGKPRA
jgi:hypothetical protein